MDSGERGEDRSHLPWAPAGRDAHEGSVVEVVAPLVPDGIVERTSEEGPTSFILASICPILFIHHKHYIARLAADAVFLSQLVAGIVPNYGFEFMVDAPHRHVVAFFKDDKLRMHGWSCEEYLVMIGCPRPAVDQLDWLNGLDVVGRGL